jgi:hypothetical protein
MGPWLESRTASSNLGWIFIVIAMAIDNKACAFIFTYAKISFTFSRTFSLRDGFK